MLNYLFEYNVMCIGDFVYTSLCFFSKEQIAISMTEPDLLA